MLAVEGTTYQYFSTGTKQKNKKTHLKTLDT